MKMKVKVNKDKCPKNHPCSAVEICPNKAISQEGFNAPLVDEKNVSGCGKCVRMCDKSAFYFGN